MQPPILQNEMRSSSAVLVDQKLGIKETQTQSNFEADRSRVARVVE